MRLVLGILVSAGLTYLLVLSGVDWYWAKFFNEHELFVWMAMPFVLAGMGVPIIIIIKYYWDWKQGRKLNAKTQFYRSLWSFGFTYLLMTVLKVFTNRVDMEPFEPIGKVDFSKEFRFGFLNSNSWWESFSEGWPSGHTMIAIGMAIAIHPLIKSKIWRSINILYPVLIALSVSTAFHWISDVISGIIIGILIGLYFSKKEFKETIVS